MKNKKVFAILLIVIIISLAIISALYIKKIQDSKNNVIPEVSKENVIKEEIIKAEDSNKKISELDFKFLKIENEKENKIYSPLSIKYALKMLEEGASGSSKTQISNVIGNYVPTKYESNKNMSLANGLFINSAHKDSINEKYIETLNNKYSAEVMFDSFADVKNINSWVSKKTLNLIPNLMNEADKQKTFILINALGIDMEWKYNFEFDEWYFDTYENEKLWFSNEGIVEKSFDNEKQSINSMNIKAVINNYDIVNELGEENIRKEVGDELRRYAKENPDEFPEEGIIENGVINEKGVEKRLDRYIDEIDKNYHKTCMTTDFEFYTDSNVKVFAKDLKEYDGTTLQYIGIMPTTKDLDKYVDDLDVKEINKIISNLKTIDTKSFKEGVVTKINGYIPKFKFDYKLNLKNDLKKLGINDVFDKEKADLSNLCEEKSAYIDEAVHKATIEFTEDGIKAAAVTEIGGYGSGGFEYLYDVPIEEIDLTFDNPYMYLIRDKKTNEIWFIGTVYEPLKWEGNNY